MNPRKWSLAKQRSLKVENGGPKVPKQPEAKKDVMYCYVKRKRLENVASMERKVSNVDWHRHVFAQ